MIDPTAGPSPYDDDYSSDDEGEDVDLSPGEEELDYFDGEDESDELDDTDDPRIMEVDTSEDEAPKLAKSKKAAEPATKGKGKNKRGANDDSDDEMAEAPATKASIDDVLTKSLKTEIPEVNGDKPLSKKQQKQLRKKLKDNAGNAVDATPTAKTDSASTDKGVKETAASPSSKSDKSDKHVQFAKTLVQGPSGGATPDPAAAKAETKPASVEPAQQKAEKGKKDDAKKSKASLGVKTVEGVTVDDKKLGTGPAAKKGDRVSMRYIGKLEADKRVFDCESNIAP